MIKKWFALATLTTFAGVMAIVADAGCSDSDNDTVSTTATDASAGGDGQTGSSTSSSSSSSSGSVAATSCLDTDPINATEIAYVKASPTVKGACTTDELTLLSNYYRTHGADQTFSAADWQNSVGRDCAACVFTDDSDPENPPTSWNPILIKNDQLETVDQGGCIENVSGNFDCGKAFQQLEVCQVDACLVKCNSQKDYDACRQDTTVLTTACKSAVDAVQAKCGGTIATYQSECNSTSFAFEGPIKIACIAPPVPPKDAGASDASPDASTADASDSDADADAGDGGT